MKWGSICFNGTCFTVKIAETMWQKTRGLMNVRNLRRNEGMLFVFRFSRRHVFWMKNVRMPLDIVFMDENFRVVDIAENLEPCEGFFCPPTRAKKRAKYALEINGGLARESAIHAEQVAKVNFTS